MPAKKSCEWPSDDPQMIAYHDREWGTPVHDDRRQFEFLILEGAQAGLSWRTVLHKREAYRAAFARYGWLAVCTVAVVATSIALLVHFRALRRSPGARAAALK